MLPNDVDVTTTYGTKAMLPNGKRRSNEKIYMTIGLTSSLI